MDFISVPFNQEFLIKDSLEKMISLHGEYLLKAWIEVNHHARTLAEAKEALKTFEPKVLEKAERYILERKRPGYKDNGPKPEFAEAAKNLHNIEVLENPLSEYNKALKNVVFYQDLITALKSLR